MERQILVPLDGSALAEAALPHAVLLARASNSTLHLLRTILPASARISFAWPMPAPINIADWIAQERKAAEDYLGLAAAPLRKAGLTVATSVIEGSAAETILTLVQEASQIQGIVMASHGRRGLERWVWGSVAEKVLRATPVPLLIAPVHGPEEAPEIARPHPTIDLDLRYVTIMVPLDGSLLAERALEPALRLARHCGAALVLMSVIPFGDELSLAEATRPPWTEDDLHGFCANADGYLAETARRLAMGGLHVQIRVQEGLPAQQIVLGAAAEHADLVVMTTHGHSGFSRLWLGSVAAHIIEQSNQPVLLVRATEERMRQGTAHDGSGDSANDGPGDSGGG